MGEFIDKLDSLCWEYHIEIKAKSFGEEIYYPNIIKFEIVSEK
jgi:hypothetical protein